jgi:hypothetical protein
VQTEAAGADMAAFNELFLEAYFGTIARAYRKHCPNHLLLGSRWLSSSASNDQLVRIAGKYLDVVSINYYSSRIEKEFLDRIHRLSGGRPILLSEWHFGTTEQGLSGGVKEVRDQRERGASYRNYVEQAAALGYVVGHQWFSFLDQALTGRWFQKYNGERGNIGLVNVADRPYKEFRVASRGHQRRRVPRLLGERPPFKLDDPRFGGKNAAKAARKVLLVPHALPGMTIDGVMNNWPGLPAERIGADNLVLGVDAGGAGADFRAAWDEPESVSLRLYQRLDADAQRAQRRGTCGRATESKSSSARARRAKAGRSSSRTGKYFSQRAVAWATMISSAGSLPTRRRAKPRPQPRRGCRWSS